MITKKKESPLSFKITARDKRSRARTGILKTKSGKIETPYLIPVATKARIIALNKKDIKNLNIKCILANTYHLHLKPGDKLIKNSGGLNKFMDFKGIIFTDSGGFQTLSLGEAKRTGYTKLGKNQEREKMILKNEKKPSFVKITDKGIQFKSVYDNSLHFIGPKESMKIQSNLGSDVIMAFDECTPANKSFSYQKTALTRTNKWAVLSLKYHNPKQALYGIIQGGQFKNLRIKSAKFISSLPFDGIAIGGSFGESYGDSKRAMHQIIDWISQYLDDRPVHMLGIGWIDDLFECVSRGIDTFDCVHPTRIARHKQLYISLESGGNKENKFTIKIVKGRYKNDKTKIDKNCRCSTCKHYTRADLYRLAKEKNNNNDYAKLATIHNLHFMLNLLEQIRKSIKAGKFQKLKKHWLK
ncbi:tRNA guanosine(34) transglycosylase Tgt [Candidatus Pacearchaeota archaeon]|nr:tRNA guanosine(34) transglycosylase Tgt [Candidatus Pacearchaeota archaeon]